MSIVQLHGDISSEEVKRIRRERPDLTMIKSLIVRPEFGQDTRPLLNEARLYEPWVDAFITDTFDPKLPPAGLPV